MENWEQYKYLSIDPYSSLIKCNICDKYDIIIIDEIHKDYNRLVKRMMKKNNINKI